jgi:hypothetical protein
MSFKEFFDLDIIVNFILLLRKCFQYSCLISFHLLFSGGDDPDDEDATESEEETSAPHPKIVSILEIRDTHFATYDL